MLAYYVHKTEIGGVGEGLQVLLSMFTKTLMKSETNLPYKLE